MKRKEEKWSAVFRADGLAGDPARLRLLVRGRVQGVGFRPSVFRFAREAGVSGSVRNTKRGVVIEIEGPARAIERFGWLMAGEAPPLARIDEITAEQIGLRGGGDFVIEGSDEPGGADALFPVDAATCEACLREMRDPEDRRFRYPFINCTNCGPRFTIIEGLPYDRPLTTMSDFSMDDFCEGQYRDPGDRRFHAEPVSCPHCGPTLRLLDENGDEMAGDAIGMAAKLLGRGMVVAVKGLGGYHLACLATDPAVVSRLRTRKKRPSKPFAVMFRDVEAIGRYALLGEAEHRLLTSPEAPIVLLRKRGRGLIDGIAPRNAYIGAFLPYTPIHHLLMEHFEMLIMTSANYTDEPLISDEVELSGLLGAIADAALVHDRRIAHKCDDSIFYLCGDAAVPIRRARGFVPEPVRLAKPVPRPILALGGQEKGTFAIARGEKVFISPHLGDLGDYRSQKNYRDELADFEKLFETRPGVVACDLHPDYFTTRLARERGGDRIIAVQHHHAHAASVMAERGLEGPVIAVSFDGTGYGADGRLWGGEFLLARYDGYERLAHLAYVPLPGGEAAVREPWRMALVYLHRLYGDGLLAPGSMGSDLFAGYPAAQVLALADRRLHSPETSSMGRLFDAVAFLLGEGARASYEAEAAVALEALASAARGTGREYRFTLREDRNAIEIEPRPLFEGLMEDIGLGISPEEIARSFHESVAALVVETATLLTARHGIGEVVVSGGVFQNRLLCELVRERAAAVPWRLHQHLITPPNDGAISLGQAAVAAAMLEAEEETIRTEKE